jgi:hypothetical protein
VVSSLQKAYLDDFEGSSIGCAPDVSPVPDFREVNACEGHAGSAGRWAGVGGAETGDVDGGAGLAGAGADEERHRPYQGQARSGGGGCC